MISGELKMKKQFTMIYDLRIKYKGLFHLVGAALFVCSET